MSVAWPLRKLGSIVSVEWCGMMRHFALDLDSTTLLPCVSGSSLLHSVPETTRKPTHLCLVSKQQTRFTLLPQILARS